MGINEPVFFGRYQSVFLGIYHTDTEGKLGQYFRYHRYEKVRIYSKMTTPSVPHLFVFFATPRCPTFIRIGRCTNFFTNSYYQINFGKIAPTLLACATSFYGRYDTELLQFVIVLSSRAIFFDNLGYGSYSTLVHNEKSLGGN